MADIEELKEMMDAAAKTDAYKIESFKIDICESFLEVMSREEIDKILGPTKAKQFMSGSMSPKNTIVTFVKLCDAANLTMQFRKS